MHSTDTPSVPEAKYLTSLAKEPGNKRKVICFSDFDGTIFMQDTGHILVGSYGCGSERRLALDEQIKSGERSFRGVSEEMWGSLYVPFNDGFKVMEKALEIDPDFQKFHGYCISEFSILSSAKNINIVANDAQIAADGSEWKPIWRHNTELGHDKALSVQEARKQAELLCDNGTIPLIVFIGDGVSDLPAVREADVLFARRGLRLEEYCVENNIAYTPFDAFADVQREIKRIRQENEEKTAGKGLPVRFNPRANLWRRVSSKNGVPLYVANASVAHAIA